MRFSRGFSLVEVLLVIAFIGIMTAVTFVSLSGKRTDEALKGAAREVAAAVRVAQNNALSGVKESGNDNGLCRHLLKWTNGNATSTLSVIHLKNNGTNCSSSSDTQEFSLGDRALENGVVFVGTGAVGFSVPQGNLYSESGPPATQSIVFTKAGRFAAVCVLPSGIVVEKLPADAAPSCP